VAFLGRDLFGPDPRLAGGIMRIKPVFGAFFVTLAVIALWPTFNWIAFGAPLPSPGRLLGAYIMIATLGLIGSFLTIED
jgi:hypothetical protein